MPSAIVVLSRSQAEAYTPQPREACISITTPGGKVASLHPGWADVLHLQFADDCWPDTPTGCGITPEQADRAVRFFANHIEASRVVIHCEAGVSRSVSMAEALAWCFGCRHLLKPSPICNPNVFVAVIVAWRKLAAKEKRS